MESVDPKGALLSSPGGERVARGCRLVAVQGKGVDASSWNRALSQQAWAPPAAPAARARTHATCVVDNIIVNAVVLVLQSNVRPLTLGFEEQDFSLTGPKGSSPDLDLV